MPIFLPLLKRNGSLEKVSMTLCLAGSRKLDHEDDHARKGWRFFAPHLSIYGFDADADACDAANSELTNHYVDWTEKHLPFVLGKTEEEAVLYVSQHPIFISLYPPDETYLKRFADLSDAASLDFTVEIETTTLDAVLQQEGITATDFLQTNVQGSELQILQGAKQTLQNVLAVQVNTSFSHLYIGQPLFADVDAYLRSAGFTLFDLTPTRYTRADIPIVSKTSPGQMLGGKAVYFRDLLNGGEPPDLKIPEQLFKLACIADAMEFPDYALELLNYLTLNYGDDPAYNFAGVIVESLAAFPHLVQQGLKSIPIVSKLQNYLKEEELSLLTSSQVNSVGELIASPQEVFHSAHYLRHNQRRLEHLASLGLDLTAKTVLEVGAGIGDHTSFFVDRGCQVVSTEGRPENVEVLRSRFPELTVKLLDMDNPDSNLTEVFDIVYCYGLLYHLQHPTEAITYLADRCSNLLLLETCVAFGQEEAIYPYEEPAADPSQAISGKAYRPTRAWVFNMLKRYFPFVYLPLTQPNHEEFPIDWSARSPSNTRTRAVFIASRQAIDNSLLLTEAIPLKQRRH